MSEMESELPEPGDNSARADMARRLALGVASGVITASQRDALLALEEPVPLSSTEAARGLNAVTIAYWAGAIAVLSAFGWFLVDRWAVLGAGGVLAVVAVYAALFLFTARVLEQHGFRHAAAIATLLAVAMTPLATWAVLALGGFWDLYPGAPRRAYGLEIQSTWHDVRWLPIDLATILAALVALRRVRFGVLALPIAIALWAVCRHAFPYVFDPDVIGVLDERLTLFPAVVLLSIGYALERRTNDGESYAVWFYLVGLVALTASLAGFYNHSKIVAAHSALGVSILLAVAAVRMGRRLFLFAAFIGLISYLSYLVFEVFGSALGFPAALATVGLVVILAAVWLQRRFPALVRQAEASGKRSIPGAPVALAGALVISLALIGAGVSDAHQRIAERYEQERADRARMHNAKKREALFGPRAPDVPSRSPQ